MDIQSIIDDIIDNIAQSIANMLPLWFFTWLICLMYAIPVLLMWDTVRESYKHVRGQSDWPVEWKRRALVLMGLTYSLYLLGLIAYHLNGIVRDLHEVTRISSWIGITAIVVFATLIAFAKWFAFCLYWFIRHPVRD